MLLSCLIMLRECETSMIEVLSFQVPGQYECFYNMNLNYVNEL